VPDGSLLYSIDREEAAQLGLDTSRCYANYYHHIRLIAMNTTNLVFTLRDGVADDEFMFRWSWADNSLSEIGSFVQPGYLRPYYSYLPNGNLVVLPWMDDRLLFNVEPEERYDQYPYGWYYGNTVHILDVQTGQHFPIFNSSSDTIV
jgi:hypothetical protein